MGRKILITESQLRYIVENIDRVDEQVSQSASNGLSVQEIQKIVETDKTNRVDLNRAKDLGQCVFIKSPKKEQVGLNDYRINAQFYNNMVSLERGLMPETPDEKIKEDIDVIIDFDDWSSEKQFYSPSINLPDYLIEWKNLSPNNLEILVIKEIN